MGSSPRASRTVSFFEPPAPPPEPPPRCRYRSCRSGLGHPTTCWGAWSRSGWSRPVRRTRPCRWSRLRPTRPESSFESMSAGEVRCRTSPGARPGNTSSGPARSCRPSCSGLDFSSRTARRQPGSAPAAALSRYHYGRTRGRWVRCSGGCGRRREPTLVPRPVAVAATARRAAGVRLQVAGARHRTHTRRTRFEADSRGGEALPDALGGRPGAIGAEPDGLCAVLKSASEKRGGRRGLDPFSNYVAEPSALALERLDHRLLEENASSGTRRSALAHCAS